MMVTVFERLRCILRMLLLATFYSVSGQANEATEAQSPQRIISLSPHLTELVYLLNAQDKLVAVSDYSDYPAEASQLPPVANYQGVNFEQVLRLRPDLILAWQGGNKPQDLARLEGLGFTLFYSNPKMLEDIGQEIRVLGRLLKTSNNAEQVAIDFEQRLTSIKAAYHHQQTIPVFYYLWPKPLMTIGPTAWGNELLSVCGAHNIFNDAINDYPEVPMESVVRRKPSIIIAVNKEPREQLLQFWRPWLPLLKMEASQVKQTNPDLLHRFTPRLLDGLERLCEAIH